MNNIEPAKKEAGRCGIEVLCLIILFGLGLNLTVCSGWKYGILLKNYLGKE